MNVHPKTWTARDICVLGLLIALCATITRLLSLRITVLGIEGVRIGFAAIPTLFSAMLFGPIGAFIHGAAADFIGFMMAPMGAYNPIFTFLAGAKDALLGLVFYLFARSGYGQGQSLLARMLPPTVVALLVKAVWTTLLTPYIFYLLYHTNYLTLATSRGSAELINVPLQLLIMVALLKSPALLRQVTRLTRN